MKFKYYNQLRKFIKEIHKHDFVYLNEIYDGGSSYNFRLKTKYGENFLKVINSVCKQQIEKNYEILSLLYLPEQLKQLEFMVDKQTFTVIYMPYIKGHKLTAGDFTPHVIVELLNTYKKITDAIVLEQKYIDKQQNLVDICQSIDEVLLQHKNWSYKLINRLFWCRFSKNIHTLPSVKQIIHGDFGMKNILLDAANSPHIIDFEMLRYGYITEDWAMLLLQLAGFSRLWGSMNKFEIYYEQVKSLADKKTWLYGVQMYYAKRLLRRLQNSHKKYGWRKNISFLCSLLRYFTVAKFIRQV